MGLMNLASQWANVVASVKTEESRDLIHDNLNTYIFPFDVHTGFVNVTTYGYKPPNAIPTDYVDFVRVFNGAANVISQWRNAITLTVDKDGSGTVLNKSTKSYKTGDMIRGWYNVSQQESNFTTYPGGTYYGNFTEQQAVRSWTLKTVYQFGEDDLFSFYIIPELAGFPDPTGVNEEVQWLFISNIIHIKNEDGSFIYDEVTFSSVNDKLATTGKQISGFVQMSAPGEGAVFPRVQFDSKGRGISYDVNPNLLADIGVRAFQAELSGLAGINNIKIIGRPIDNPGQFNSTVYSPRVLFSHTINFGVPDPLNWKADQTNVFYLTNGKPEIESYYPNWRIAMQSNWNDAIKKNADGWLETDYSLTLASNPSGIMFKDSAWQMNYQPLGQDIYGAVVMNQSYDVQANWAFNTKSATTGTTYGYGTLVSLRGMEHAHVWDMMNVFGLMFSQMTSFPIASKQNIPWSFNFLGIFNSTLWGLIFGFGFGYAQNTVNSSLSYPHFSGLPLFINADVYRLYCNAWWNIDPAPQPALLPVANNGRVPLIAFYGGDDTVGGLIGSNAMSTTIGFNLSDKCLLAVWNDSTGTNTGAFVTASSLYLGQLDPVETTTKYLWDPLQSYVLPADTAGTKTDTQGSENYIIDAIIVQAVGYCPLRFTCFSKDPGTTNPYDVTVWQATLQSQSMFSNNPHAWTTVYQTSYLNDWIADDVKYTFPQPLSLPDPQLNDVSVTLPNLFLNYQGDAYPTDSIRTFTEDDGEDGIVLFDFGPYGFNDFADIKAKYQHLNIPLFTTNSCASLNHNHPVDPEYSADDTHSAFSGAIALSSMTDGTWFPIWAVDSTTFPLGIISYDSVSKINIGYAQAYINIRFNGTQLQYQRFGAVNITNKAAGATDPSDGIIEFFTVGSATITKA